MYFMYTTYITYVMLICIIKYINPSPTSFDINML